MSELDQITDTPRERALQVIRHLVSVNLAGIPSKVYLIGSCARGDNRRDSDIDIAIETLQPAPKTLISNIRCVIEQSEVPFFVDVFDFTQLDEHYRAEIKKEGVLWIGS